MQITTLLLIALIGAEAAYRIERRRWNIRKTHLEPLTNRNAWMVALGLVKVEYPPARPQLYAVGLIIGFLGWLLLALLS